MSWEVANEHESLGQFASNQGFVHFVKEAEQFPTLNTLFKSGISQHVPAVVEELKKLAKESEPDTRDVALQLAQLIDGQKTIIIHDGLITEEGEQKVFKTLHPSHVRYQSRLEQVVRNKLHSLATTLSDKFLEGEQDVHKVWSDAAREASAEVRAWEALSESERRAAREGTTASGPKSTSESEQTKSAFESQGYTVKQVGGGGKYDLEHPEKGKVHVNRDGSWEHSSGRTGNDASEALRLHHTSDKISKVTPNPLIWIDMLDWDDVVAEAEELLGDTFSSAGSHAVANVTISSNDMISDVNTVALDYAQKRAAEMVGKKWVNDKLVDNPDAKWSIAETTRKELREIIEAAFEKQTTMSDLAAQIKNAGTFSDSRAKMIAETEIQRAEHLGNLAGWKRSGVVKKVGWLLSADHDVTDDCDDNAADSPYDIDKVPDIPHPRCHCSLVAYFA